MVRTEQRRRQIVVYRCPECGHEIEQQLFGTQHTSGLSCIPCESGMERISLAESWYDYDDELVEGDGGYTIEIERPDGDELIEELKREFSNREEET